MYDQIEDVEYCAPGANNGPQPAGKLFGSPPPIHTHTEQSPDDVVEPERRSIRISQRDREAIARSLESHKPKLESQRSIVDDKPKDTVKFLNHEVAYRAECNGRMICIVCGNVYVGMCI